MKLDVFAVQNKANISGEASFEALVMQFLYKDLIRSAEGASLLGGSGACSPGYYLNFDCFAQCQSSSACLG